MSLERNNLLTFIYKMFIVFYIVTVTIIIPLNILTIVKFISANIVDRNKSYWRVNLNEKSKNGGEIHPHMNKKQNDYQNVNLPLFFICGSKLINFFILFDLGADKQFLVFILYSSSSDL